jgi:hypothetical protein
MLAEEGAGRIGDDGSSLRRATHNKEEIMLSPQEVRRNAFLHEAGHAVVALELGLLVREVACDGELGHCRADLSPTDQAAVEAVLLRHKPIATADALQQVVDAYFGKLGTLLGGIAGESLELGVPIFSTRRAADDFSTFFGFMASMSRGVPLAQADPIWMAAYAKAQDIAWEIVRKRAADVRRIAAALEGHGTIFLDDLLKLV